MCQCDGHSRQRFQDCHRLASRSERDRLKRELPSIKWSTIDPLWQCDWPGTFRNLADMSICSPVSLEPDVHGPEHISAASKQLGERTTQV